RLGTCSSSPSCVLKTRVVKPQRHQGTKKDFILRALVSLWLWQAIAMKIAGFRAETGKEIRLDEWPTRADPYYKSKNGYEQLLRKQVVELSELQNRLYAHDRYAVLLIFQAMDAAGKDSAIKHVMSGVNPQGCQVFSFKHPSAEDLDHDFLWRTTRDLPE